MKLYHLLFALWVILLVLLSPACQNDNGDDTPQEFDRTLFLTNYAENIIAKDFVYLADALNQMGNEWASFKANPCYTPSTSCSFYPPSALSFSLLPPAPINLLYGPILYRPAPFPLALFNLPRQSVLDRRRLPI